MEDIIIFSKPLDLYCFEKQLIVRKGLLHKNEVIMNKKESLNEFIEILKFLVKDNELEINSNESIYKDFKQLMKVVSSF